MSEELTGQHKALADTLSTQFTDRMKSLEESASVNKDAIVSLSEGVEAITAKLESRQHHGTAYVEGADDAFKTDDPARSFSLHRGIIGAANNWDYTKSVYKDEPNQNLWPERDILEASTQKAQSAGVNTEGGFAVPEQFNSTFIPILLAKSVAAQMGVQFHTDFRGSPVTWPRIDSASQAFWVAENVAPTESDVELGQISMSPHDLSALIPVSNRLLFQTGGSFETMLRDHMARIHAIELDRAFFLGTGAAGEPLGLKNTAGIGSHDWSTPTPAKGVIGTHQNITDKLSSIVETVDTANALEGELGFVMHPAGAGYFREVKGESGHPILISGDPNAGRPNLLYDYKYATTTQLSTTDLFFGNFADAMIGQWGTMVIDSSNVAGNAFFRRQTYIRANIAVDVAFMHEASFVATTLS